MGEPNRVDNLRSILPKWETSKVVHAVMIDHIEYGADHQREATIYPLAELNLPSFTVPPEYVAKHAPRAGGYYILYEDNYESFAPASAFEPYAMPFTGDDEPATYDPDEDEFRKVEPAPKVTAASSPKPSKTTVKPSA